MPTRRAPAKVHPARRSALIPAGGIVVRRTGVAKPAPQNVVAPKKASPKSGEAKPVKSLRERLEDCDDLVDLCDISELKVKVGAAKLTEDLAYQLIDDDDGGMYDKLSNDDPITFIVTVGQAQISFTAEQQKTCCGIVFCYDIRDIGYPNTECSIAALKLMELIAKAGEYTMVRFTHMEDNSVARAAESNGVLKWNVMEFKNQRTRNRLLDCHKFI